MMRMHLDLVSRRTPLAIAVAAVLLACGCIAGTASGKLCSRCINSVGLNQNQPYTYHPGCRGKAIDPINVVWIEPKSHQPFANVVATDFSAFSFNNWFQERSETDPQAVQNSSQTCSAEATDVATGNGESDFMGSRGHVRLFDTVNARSTEPFVVGDAHADESASCGHFSVSFTQVKRSVYGFWRNRAKQNHYQYWGNTRSFHQCNGSFQHDTGFVAVMNANPNQ